MNEENPRQQKNKTRLIDFLAKLKQEGAIDDEVEDDCLRLLDTSWISALEYLRGLKKLSPDDLGNEWGAHIGIAYVNPEKTVVDPVLFQALPESFCRDKNCLPLFHFGGTVTTAMTDPFDDATTVELEHRLKRRISPVFTFQSDITRSLVVQGLSRESLTSAISDLETSLARTLESESQGDEAVAKLPDVMELVDTLLLWSRKERASDIHIEPMEKSIRVRFRIDGILQVRMRLDKRLLMPIVSRLKVLAGLDITEKRRPQDGNLRTTIRGVLLEFRFSTVPSVYGERIVLRSTTETGAKSVIGLERLGLAPAYEEALRDIIASPNGVFFVTGPTGSGKSTTLFSVIQELNKPEVNIMTVEDPVERRLPGINQTQVNKPVNVSFASVLRAFLRQDPDVILIGEIRDLETAKIAAEAALTGHLVLSTMHTNSALQAITRLMDIGVEPFLVAPSIIGVMGQRLLRKLCPNCKESYRPSPQHLEPFFTNTEGVEVSFFRPVGCDDCDNTGYQGRVAVHELFNISDPMRSVISRNGGLVEIEELAREEGYRSMRYDALKRVLQGITSIEEVVRVVPD